ncbi:MAG: hypothetical protein ACFFER_08490 [Candidatus Thorarchaeota archaeon]
MSGGCPCGRVCSDCIYEILCGGCLGESCIHVRHEKRRADRTWAKCQFCRMKGIDDTCPTKNAPPPQEFQCLPPKALEQTISHWSRLRSEYTKQPSEPDWPLLIPEVSDITETTSRLHVWPDEGDWSFPDFETVAWDMTGYLFDKVQGANWVFNSEELAEEDWHNALGYDERKIEHLLLVDRLPDLLAIQTPPTAIMVAYLNRLWAFQWRLFGEDAPRLWLLTHGYPSYIDWPPAWHWNLGIRMLSSLAEYIGSQSPEMMGAAEGTWYPDKSRQTDRQLHIPFAQVDGENRLLWDPDIEYEGTYEMIWPRFPGIIPFVPGADTNQLAWFTRQIVKMGYTTVALDAMNSIAHENFKGLPEGVSAVLGAGAKHVMIYGPWPLHPPRKYVPIHNVSYIPSALHIDMTNQPPRFWRKRREKENGEKRWTRLPNYRRVSLGEVIHGDTVEICKCPACDAALEKETDPRSVWQWGHLLQAGEGWMRSMLRARKRRERLEIPDKTTRLWYQGPSYTVFRRCLHYSPEIQWVGIDFTIESLVISGTAMHLLFPDGVATSAEWIQWSWINDDHQWAQNFPELLNHSKAD